MPIPVELLRQSAVAGHDQQDLDERPAAATANGRAVLANPGGASVAAAAAADLTGAAQTNPLGRAEVHNQIASALREQQQQNGSAAQQNPRLRLGKEKQGFRMLPLLTCSFLSASFMRFVIWATRRRRNVPIN